MKKYARELYEFPSPCGDKLKFLHLLLLRQRSPFPSPCGDKLKFEQSLNDITFWSSFRPLAGIS